MPDDVFGDPVPQELRPSRKRQLSDWEQRTQPQRIADCLDEPLIYEMAELLPASASCGCPRQYPAVVYVLLAALMTVTGSKRSAVGTLDTRQWRAVRASIRRNAGRTAAALLPVTPPSRGQYLYAEEKLLAPSIELLQDLFEQRAVQQALHQGLFPVGAARNWVRPERRQLLVGDATVPKAPSKAEHAFTVDTATGEMRRHRVDPAARLYYENGEKEKRLARGTKWFFASARDDGYWQRVILAVRHVAGGDYEDEAAVAVRSFSQLSRRLPGCMGVIYDGAFRGVHRDALARLGLLVINRQHGSVKPRAYELLRFGRCRHDLWCDQGRIAERVLLDDGTSTLIPVPVSRLEHRQGRTKSRWYHLLLIPCRHGAHTYRVQVGITTTPSDRIGTDPATGRRFKSDTERDFHRAEYLQQIPESTLTHQQLYPYRSDSESVHNQLDQSMWNNRMISYGLERQKVFLLCFALAQNATSRRVFLERSGALQAVGAGRNPA
ncbi:hypothetical protein [Streptomyces aurantiogriseus]|uniref:Transposase n=1 Tax=Streptomyces aurantiogriseus TaxID=66870 RepID=A0A918C454_9ACTN|nr:hypothetical protein [Streptomyces aurantiogriseus]GGR05747.1 hypothetical protein GCM10010251_21800 [Streptomyces aurantiogriseus]